MLIISQASVKFLSSRREKRQLKKFVVDKLNDVKDCLGQIEVRLPELIEEDRELCSELYGQLLCNLERETHFQGENKDLYRRIRDEGSQCRDQLALFGIKKCLYHQNQPRRIRMERRKVIAPGQWVI